MARQLRVYGTWTMVSPAIVEALGAARHMSQQRAYVAATSAASAARLIGVSAGHMREYGSETWNDAEVAIATAEPGQVFIGGNVGGRQIGEPVRVRVTREWPEHLSVGTTSPEWSAELHQLHKDRTAANAAQRAEQEAEWQAQRDRREQTLRADREALERITPLLERLGIRPDTVVLGTGGLKLPGEALETLVRLAIEGDEMRRM